MKKILFFGIPAFGHINPTLGMISELVKQGDEVVYFCTEEFRKRIEKTGAKFRAYKEWEGFSKNKPSIQNKMDIQFMIRILKTTLESCEKVIDNILEEIGNEKFDYVGYSANFPFGNIIAKILNIPSFSSFAIFATPEEMMPKEFGEARKAFANDSIIQDYKEISDKLSKKYDIEMPKLQELFFNRGDINFAYTSKYFVANIEKYDDTYKFIGPPIYDRKEDISDFPYKEIKGRKVVYISLGTVYSNYDIKLYDIFFKAFKDVNVAVVMTAYKTDLSEFDVPKNFIVKNYISQTEILKYADVAVTHSGMNSTNDLLFNNVPFVAIPLGADQPYMANRAAQLGACISLEKDKLTPEILRDSVREVLENPKYIENIKKINESFRECGGYKKAAEEISKLKDMVLV
ncbi:glycosyl transferase [Clostridium sp. SHJSY1]|uniref:macrolide family glycosyltransferase n=1 Tax=Clostridium sp. SHJSY1 TaxID=2942483 RepID=UPI002876D1AB|nr:macrolide family glycosyltransferase [Clostridium sp. SHJSY1]MDS0525428.1 glycosyl transferase [Clostridium sp. SHJSY1]